MDKRTLIVIPYLSSAAQGHELQLAVAGWQQHFKQPHDIVIIGDRDSNFDALHSTEESSVSLRYRPRACPIEKQYTPHIDHAQKFSFICERYSSRYNGFIYACDDMYAVKDFTLRDVKKLKYPKVDREIREDWDWRREGGWLHDLGKTADLCRREGLPTNNWVCHLPVYYDMNRLMAIISKYDCENNSYILENLYFNRKYDWRPVEPAERFGYEVKTASPGIRTAEDAGTIWISNANCGWSEELENILAKHYEIKL